MIVRIDRKLSTFAEWKTMVHGHSEKIKEYGMTFLYAGSKKGDDTKFTTIIKFDTMEGLEAFKADDEIHKARAVAGLDLANTVTTPMGNDLLEQYKG